MIYHLSYSLKNIFIMYPDREKALAKGRRKGKTFIRVFCGIFISVGIILLIVGIAVGVSGHTFRQKAEPTDALSWPCAERAANRWVLLSWNIP